MLEGGFSVSEGHSLISLPWAQLGWSPEDGAAGPLSEDGPIGILVLAPWCPDCIELSHRVKAILRCFSGPRLPFQRIWIAGEFVAADAMRDWARDQDWEAPLLFGSREKTETARNQANFRLIRAAAGDGRKWGLPLWIEGELDRGTLNVAGVRVDL